MLPLKNVKLLNDDCLGAGSDTAFVGSAEKCELVAGDTIDKLQGGQAGRVLQSGQAGQELRNGRTISAQQLKVARLALHKARSRGLSDKSPRTRALLLKALSKH